MLSLMQVSSFTALLTMVLKIQGMFYDSVRQNMSITVYNLGRVILECTKLLDYIFLKSTHLRLVAKGSLTELIFAINIVLPMLSMLKRRKYNAL